MSEQVVIANPGVLATWRFNSQQGQSTSNQVWNPGGLLWLPVIREGSTHYYGGKL